MNEPPRRRAPIARLGIPALCALAAGHLAAAPASQPTPGSYCPLPELGEASACLLPARETYREFFSGVAENALTDETLARVEADVAAGATSERSYLALSSLAYGYYRIAQRASAAGADPELVARLERWNGLLARAYERSPDDARFRAAVSEAALDLHRRAPAVQLECTDADGNPAQCTTTEVLVQALSQSRETTGVRGALGRLLDRLLGSDDP